MGKRGFVMLEKTQRKKQKNKAGRLNGGKVYKMAKKKKRPKHIKPKNGRCPPGYYKGKTKKKKDICIKRVFKKIKKR